MAVIPPCAQSSPYCWACRAAPQQKVQVPRAGRRPGGAAEGSVGAGLGGRREEEFHPHAGGRGALEAGHPRALPPRRRPLHGSRPPRPGWPPPCCLSQEHPIAACVLPCCKCNFAPGVEIALCPAHTLPAARKCCELDNRPAAYLWDSGVGQPCMRVPASAPMKAPRQ